jgi:quercetin dioxygenase-like cupin family protein
MNPEPLSFLGRSVGPVFSRRVVTIAGGATRPYDESEWRDALVIVESGELDLECSAGGRRRFRPGNVLWFTGLGLVALHCAGAEPVVLVAVSRREAAG